MWKFFNLFENGIHLPDIESDIFHCSARQNLYDPEPSQIVSNGFHPTIQFRDIQFFNYPYMHVKMKIIPSGDSLGVTRFPGKFPEGRILMDGVYPTPPKTSIANMVLNKGVPVMSSIDNRVSMIKNFLASKTSTERYPADNIRVPGHSEMRTICVPPDGSIRRLIMTVNSMDEKFHDLVEGPMGYSVIDIRHKLPPTPLLAKLAQAVTGSTTQPPLDSSDPIMSSPIYELNKLSFF